MTLLPGTQPAKPVAKALPNQASKKTQPSTQSSSPGLNPPQTDQQQEQQALKCPRCDSSNTKFCYYNNYSLAQPRHFCKTCRRYWTKGGALRNVPVGSGSHKNKRLKPSYSSSSKDFPGDISGLKLFHGESAALDFQLGGFEIPRGNPPNPLNVGIYESQFPALGEGNPSSIIGGMNFPLPMVIHPLQPPAPSSSGSLRNLCDPSSMKIDGNLASSIESLSCINQDLHWKLQQQRLAAIYADSIPRDNRAASSNHEPFGGSAPGSHQENIANGSNSAPPATEWFFGNSASYSSVTPSPTDSGSNGNENTSCNNWHRNSNSNNNNGNVGALIHHHQGWGARNVQQQYGSLP